MGIRIFSLQKKITTHENIGTSLQVMGLISTAAEVSGHGSKFIRGYGYTIGVLSAVNGYQQNVLEYRVHGDKDRYQFRQFGHITSTIVGAVLGERFGPIGGIVAGEGTSLIFSGTEISCRLLN